MRESTLKEISILIIDIRKLTFPIFWFPILLPLSITLIAVFADCVASINNKKPLLDLYTLLMSSMKNINLSFLSTDIWALATLLKASNKLGGLKTWGLGCGQIIVTFVHLFFYFLIFVLTLNKYPFWIPLIIVLIGFYFVFIIRYYIFANIEIPETENI